MKPSKYQQDIYNSLITTRNHIVVAAGPGSGKTFTLTELAKLIPFGKTAVAIAFNKSIVNEFKKKFPSTVQCLTMHSLGLKSIFKHFNDVTVDAEGKKQIHFIEPYFAKEENHRNKWSSIYRVDDIMKKARVTMTPPNIEEIAAMCDAYVIDYDEEIVGIACRALRKLNDYNEDSERHKIWIDYVDMVALPALNTEIRVPQFDYVLIDEAQDMSKLDQVFLDRLPKPVTGRMVVVGDDKQSIYGFRGSDPNSFKNFMSKANTVQLPLSISYRCPKSVVRLAQTIYPDVEEYINNPEGVVRDGNIDEIQEGDFVLSRTTRPLIDVFFELIDAGKKAKVMGKDMERGLLRLLSGLEAEQNATEAKEYLDGLMEKTVNSLKAKGIKNPKKHPRYGQMEEKMGILHLLFSKYETVAKVEEFIQNVFDDEERDGVKLMTIHRAKGLENKRVFVIETYDGKDLIPNQYAVTEDQLVQEKNLKFVAVTRSKQELIFLHL